MTKNLTNLRFAVLLALASIAVYFAAGQITTRVVNANTGTKIFVPYTLEAHTVALNKDGVFELTERRLTAVRSDGSEVWLGQFPGREQMGPVRRLIRSNGRVSIAIEKIGAKISQMLPGRAKQERHEKVLDASSQCRFVYEKSAGAGTLLGTRVSISEYSDSPDRRTTQWRALDYECAVLATRHERLKDGKWVMHVESIPVLLVAGEPKAELFDEAFYDKLQEMPPSEAQRRLYATLGVTEVQCPRCFNPKAVERLDSDYYAGQGPG